MNAQAIVIPIVPQIELKRILYATDLSEASLAALPLVSTIARKYGSHVFVANIWAPVPYTMMTPEMAGTMDVTHEEEIKAQAGALLTQQGIERPAGDAYRRTGWSGGGTRSNRAAAKYRSRYYRHPWPHWIQTPSYGIGCRRTLPQLALPSTHGGAKCFEAVDGDYRNKAYSVLYRSFG